uniref:Major intrinsically disordered Notch2-binding receptor 1-like C-terminal domain-containing protein n=1 Tax=Neolamprologus brichardi TaxID=32507 RepID=A0A3Q4GEN5_NEOBR
MDISALPNNNHPEKFLQLDVGMLPATHRMFQVGAVMSSQKQWQNRIYSQKHITPSTLKTRIRQNPLYMDVKSEEDKTPKDLDFWLEDLYTPGFDSLLIRKEAERRRRLCKIISSIIVIVLFAKI